MGPENLPEKLRRPPLQTRDSVSRRMRRQRSRDTAPELELRSELHRRGLRYRVHRRPVPTLRRTADVVFGPSRVAVFVDGCFWHGCPVHRDLAQGQRGILAREDRGQSYARQPDRRVIVRGGMAPGSGLGAREPRSGRGACGGASSKRGVPVGVSPRDASLAPSWSASMRPHPCPQS